MLYHIRLQADHIRLQAVVVLAVLEAGGKMIILTLTLTLTLTLSPTLTLTLTR